MKRRSRSYFGQRITIYSEVVDVADTWRKMTRLLLIGTSENDAWLRMR